ncbi:hypothetical protein DKM44_10870 [Deinococcus irradiatisoli]|uniref:Uncharacterized protein n=1 Tax=Deinococcus irradiatisoli TaxID=2202254 RepID=A0A2Z3JQG4_9DEIO|nr:hypothetical protein [Deinococcus irradiatisoli]AWN23668.1 hypothetical protein DKM44_10870 [Deinococcus irradiatisoli]
MRVLLLLLALAVLALYLTLGLRLGYATLTPLYLLNAQGETDYPFRLYEAGKLQVTGSCQGRSGVATLRFMAPDGTELSAVRCPPGNWSLNLSGSGDVGVYTLSVEYQHYTGRLELNSSY